MIIQMRNKAEKYPLSKYRKGYGYFIRARAFRTYGIVIHTTNGNRGSSYENEIDFLYRAPKVTAHFIVSKDGRITQLLDIKYAAWHAGEVNDRQYGNNDSIGIEWHYAIGENKITPLMYQSTLELCKKLRIELPIAGIKKHREIAINPDGTLGRKQDPSNMTDEEFEVWRNRVMSDVRLVKRGTIIYTDTVLKNKAVHINTTNIHKGIVLQDILLDVTPLGKHTWLTNGFGFIHTQ